MIEIILQRIVEWGKSQKKGKDNYFSDYHEKISKHARNLSYHAEFGVFPSELIEKAAPNEDSKEFDYRKANYKQVTKPAWDKALSFTYRVFNEQNFSIIWKDEDYEKYFNYEFPKYGDFVKFFIDVIPKMKFADPNAVVVVRPS